MILLLVGVLLAPVAAVGGAIAQPEKVPGPEITISLEHDAAAGDLRVGQTVMVKIVLDNLTGKPLSIQDWEASHVLILRFDVHHIPGQVGAPLVIVSLGRPVISLAGLRVLPPGRTVIERNVIPMIPGKGVMIAQLWCPPEADRASKEAWHGRIQSPELKVGIAADMPAELKRRYEDLKKQLLAPEAKAEDQVKILTSVAGEKHYFAARFIREACDSLSPGPVKDEAVRHLLELARFGTAYESFEYLLGVIGDDKTPVETRQEGLAWLARCLRDDGGQTLASQANYSYPEASLKMTLQVIRKIADGRDPYLAVEARQVLKELADQEKKDAQTTKSP
jgi:hypothetical protein